MAETVSSKERWIRDRAADWEKIEQLPPPVARFWAEQEWDYVERGETPTPYFMETAFERSA